jgi:hypothetical protein
MTTQRFRDEFRLFLAFIRRPSLVRRVPRSLTVTSWLGDWWPDIRLSRLLAWAATLWVLNVLVLGPVVLAVFELSGATHRINVNDLPWLQAILWAPLVEEMLFRFGLRRPVMVLGLVPLMTIVLLNGLAWWANSLLVLTVLGVWWFSVHTHAPSANGYKWLRRYCSVFPWVVHLSVLAFAALHIKNFVFDEMAWWMMAVLVTPQWVTGLVLSWIRVQRGVGTAMLLHGIFNAGPLSVVWVALQWLGD